jgi:hypothetical protein
MGKLIRVWYISLLKRLLGDHVAITTDKDGRVESYKCSPH